MEQCRRNIRIHLTAMVFALFLLLLPAGLSRAESIGDCEAGLDLFSDYGAVTHGDLSSTATINGPIFVGGDLVLANSFTVQDNSVAAADPILTVVGQVRTTTQNTIWMNMNNGSVVVGSGNTVSGGGNQYFVNNNAVGFNMNSGGTVTTADLTVQAADVSAGIDCASDGLSLATTNNIVTVPDPNGQPSNLVFAIAQLEADGFAYFEIDAADLFDNSKVQNILIEVEAPLTEADVAGVLINVTGGPATFQYGNMGGNLLNNASDKVLWHFPDATAVNNTNGREWKGSILAPQATFNSTGKVTGGVVVNAIDNLASIGEKPLSADFSGLCATLPVTIGYVLVEAEADDGAVLFTWQTATEIGNLGFNLLALVDGQMVQLNELLIPSTVIDSVEPTDYQFRVESEATTFFLQDVTLRGVTDLHGPFALGIPAGMFIGADPGVPAYQVFLPFLLTR